MLGSCSAHIPRRCLWWPSKEVPRNDAKTQRQNSGFSYAPLRLYVTTISLKHRSSVEVFQVLDLPLTVHEASLVKSDRGYCREARWSETVPKKNSLDCDIR